jgi:trehalose synthase
MATLNDYRRIVGDEKIDEIIREAKPLKGKYIVHVNSTFYGGGVAEVLDSLVYLMNQTGIKAGWRFLKGSLPFFEITKSFHNGSQGADIKLTQKIKKTYEEINRHNSVFMHLEKSDAIIAHDPQTLPLIKFYKKQQPWIWRCHIDITEPNKKLWNYLKGFINLYDEMIISDEQYRKEDIKIPQTVIMPSIDPLNEKNKKLSDRKVKAILSEQGIKFNKPIVSQISRYDIWKDQCGVIDAFKKVRKKADCQLVLLGNSATDDPEGLKIYYEVAKKANKIKDITLLLNVENNDLTVNALQRASEIVLQKSTREGFALTVSEALWKGTPVIGGNVGGIPNQIINGKNGYLVNNINECAERTIELLRDNESRKKMGQYAHKFVKENFLITRHLLDYIKMLKRVMKVG